MYLVIVFRITRSIYSVVGNEIHYLHSNQKQQGNFLVMLWNIMPLFAFINVSRLIIRRWEACSAVQKAVFNFKWLILIRQLEWLQQRVLGALNHVCHKICLVVLAAWRLTPTLQPYPLVGLQQWGTCQSCLFFVPNSERLAGFILCFLKRAQLY